MIAHVLHACAILSLPFYLSTVDLSSCRSVTCNMAIYGVCILLRGSGGLAPQVFCCESMPTSLNLTYIHPYDCPCFARMRNSFTSVDLSTVDLSTCRPVTCNMAIYGVCILLRGFVGLAPQAFRCESMPTPLNLTYSLPYDCPCFERMRNSFTSVDLSTVDCRPVNLSTYQRFVGYYLCTIHLRCVISSYYSLRLVFTSST